MKKFLTLALIGTCVCATSVMAAKRDCSYSPLQDIVRTARDEKDIEKLIERDVSFNITPRCGGDILQLAIFRGNPTVLKTLLEKAKLPVDKMVSIADFPIDGAPKEIPFLHFAAYYAPRADMMDLVIQVSENVFAEDKRGENLLWYLRRNPVLMNTELYDKMKMQFVLKQTNKKEEGQSEKDAVDSLKEEKKDSSSKSEAKSDKREAPAAAKPVSGKELVEPERKFNPDAQQDSLKSDF